MLSPRKILNIIGIIAAVIFAILILDYFLEVALDGWNNPR